MKIVLVGPAYPLRGGIAQHSAVLYERLRGAGHDVHFVSFIKQFPNWLFPGKTQLESSKDVIDVHAIPRFAPLGPRSWWRTYREIKKLDPEMVIFNWWMPFFGPGFWAVQRWIRKHTRAKVVYVLHNVIPHEHRFGDKFLSRLAVSQADYFLAQSKVVERDFFTWFPKIAKSRVRFSPHPIYDCYKAFDGGQAAARAELGLLPDQKVLLFFGFVREYKGLKLLLEAMPEILKFDSRLKLVVVGEFYSPRAEYDQLISDLGIKQAVLIRDDYVPNEEVGKYFAAADCAVLPYRSATQSGIIQIAYALDLPVITTNVGGLGEVVIENVTGFIVPPEQPALIADAVKKFYTTGGRAAYEANIRRERRKFEWDGLIDNLLSFQGDGS